jgi:hypothetical protein
MGFQVNRVGYLYGISKEGKNPKNEKDEEVYYENFCDVIYEPNQKGDEKGFEILKDDNEETIEKLSNLLGLQRLGWIITNDGNRENPLTGEEILMAATFQEKYGENFVTLTVSKNSDNDQVEFEAYQVSDQCVELNKKGMLKVDKNDPKNIICSKEVQLEGTSKMTTGKIKIKKRN